MMVLVIVALAAVLLLRPKSKPVEEIKDMAGSVGKAGGDFGYVLIPSPNKSSRGGKKANALVWHYTAGPSLQGAVTWFQVSGAQASAHFIIGRAGDVVQMVPLAEAAWHAGDADITNSQSIGIELVSPGWVEQDGKGGWKDSGGGAWVADVQPRIASMRFPNGAVITKWWVPYTTAQMRAAKELVQKLKASPYAACIADQCGHEDVARPMGRKTDPGPLFDWDEISTFDQRKAHHRTTVPGVV